MPVVPRKSSESLVLDPTGPHLRPCPNPHVSPSAGTLPARLGAPRPHHGALRRRRRGPVPAGTAAPRRAHAGAPTSVTVVANTADDIWVHGLKVCPDLDTVMYTLGDGIDTDRGWGRREETWHAKEELAAYGVEPSWFGLGDRDIGTHLVRTQMLEAGFPLSAVTAALCRRWLSTSTGPGGAVADDRRPRRDARRHRRSRVGGTQGRALPGVLDPPPCRGPGPRRRAHRHRGGQARTRRARGDQ